MRHLRGYTLIELLVTVTLVGILITTSLSAYSKSRDKQSLQSDTELLLSAITQAKKDSSSGNNDCLGPYLGEQISIVANSANLNISSLCRDSTGTVRTTTLASSFFVTDATFTIRPLNQGIDLGPGLNTLSIDYSFNNSTYRLEISRGGSLKYVGVI